MYRNNLCAIAFAILAGIAPHSAAGIIDMSGAGFSFPDNDPAGVTSTITVSADEVITDVDVVLLDARHTWLGDLTARIISPAGTIADLFVRTGPGFFGDSSNLRGDYTFSDGGINFAAAAASRRGNQNVFPGTYSASTNGDGLISLADAFAGESTAGDWTLFISDNAQFDLGSIDGWGLNIESSVANASVPEPSSLLLVTVACVGLLRRRPRRSLSNESKTASQ